MEFLIDSPKYGIKKCEVDDEDASIVIKYNWYIAKRSNSMYLTAHKGNIKIYLHREIMNCQVGKVIDHINRNGLDCRKENMRICNQRENSYNKGMSKNNKSGYKGVSFFPYGKRSKRWNLIIKVNYKNVYLGYFDTKEEAYAAYCEASKRYHGEFGRIA